MSPRAACRLATLGFAEVYDYTAGKAEWLGYGLPTEGKLAGLPAVGAFARQDVATCDLGNPVGTVQERMRGSPYGFALVVSSSGVLLGRLRRTALDGNSGALAGEAMEAGPSTVRPNVSAEKLAARLRERQLRTAIVTTPDGRLVGVVRTRDLPA
jgi:CBS domain-containing protein